MNQQAKTLEQLIATRGRARGPRRTRTIAITSGKGGVGKTTLAANLAVVLQLKGVRVTLVDVDLGTANVDAMLGTKPRFTLEHVLEGGRTVSDIVVEGPGGLRRVSVASGIEELANLTPWQQDRLWQGFRELDAEADLVLVDTASGIAPDVLSVLAAVPELLVVTMPEPAAITDAYALVKVLARHNPAATVHLIVNRAPTHHAARATANRILRVARRFLGVEVDDLGFVLEDPMVEQAAAQHAPFVSAYPRCDAARGVGAIANRLRAPVTSRARRSLADCMQALSKAHLEGPRVAATHAADAALLEGARP